MAHANDLIIVFLALELLSIPLYVLAGFALPRMDSEESSLKYFLLGAFASALCCTGWPWSLGRRRAPTYRRFCAAAYSAEDQLNTTLIVRGRRCCWWALGSR